MKCLYLNLLNKSLQVWAKLLSWKLIGFSFWFSCEAAYCIRVACGASVTFVTDSYAFWIKAIDSRKFWSHNVMVILQYKHTKRGEQAAYQHEQVLQEPSLPTKPQDQEEEFRLHLTHPCKFCMRWRRVLGIEQEGRDPICLDWNSPY